MNILIKKTAIASVFLAGIAVTLILQAHEAPDSLNTSSGGEGNATMPMDMQNKQGMSGMMNMAGMSEQMVEMMSACMKMMETHDNDHHKPKVKYETQE